MLRTELVTRFANVDLSQGSIACSWLGQAGYLLKGSNRATIMIDPYLSDYSEEVWGLRRQFPPPVTADAAVPDVLLVTHWHTDHLDVPTGQYYAAMKRTVLIAPPSCAIRARVWNWPEDLLVELHPGESYDHRGIQVTATFAHHDVPGAIVEDAVGYLLSLAGVTLWHAGDTEYHARLRSLGNRTIDVAFLPINGTGGNMNAYEAALLAWQIGAKVAVPMHYGMWDAEDYGASTGRVTLDPAVFAETLRKLGGSSAAAILHVGELILFDLSDGDIKLRRL